MINARDVQILQLLQENARVSNAAIARRIKLTPSATLQRIRKLEQRGIIRSYETRVDPKAVGMGLTAFVAVVTDEVGGNLDAGRRLAEIAEVQEVHNVAGEDCYLCKVRARDAEALGELIRTRIGAIDSVSRTRTTIVMETLLESTRLPVAASTADDDGPAGNRGLAERL